MITKKQKKLLEDFMDTLCEHTNKRTTTKMDKILLVQKYGLMLKELKNE